jgi:hypothetical protein
MSLSSNGQVVLDNLNNYYYEIKSIITGLWFSEIDSTNFISFVPIPFPRDSCSITSASNNEIKSSVTSSKDLSNNKSNKINRKKTLNIIFNLDKM